MVTYTVHLLGLCCSPSPKGIELTKALMMVKKKEKKSLTGKFNSLTIQNLIQ